MRTVEIDSMTDSFGHLHIDYKTDKYNSKVKVLLLIDDSTTDFDDEKLWLKSISKNPAFDFLKDKDEDKYTLNDGKAIDN
jgi:hypothetical protein